MLTSLVYFQQANVKKSKRFMKIVNIYEKKSSYIPDTLRKNMSYNNIKSHKKADLYTLSTK